MSALELSHRLPTRFAASRPAQGGRDGDPISITEVASASVQVTARKNQCDALAAALSQRLGVALPGPGSSTRHATDDATIIWLQPASWLILSDATLAASLLTDFSRAHPGLASWVEHTHGYCLLRVSGAAVRSVLARLCRLDLHARVFAPGACAATLVGHVSALVRRVPQSDATNDSVFDVLVAASYADWLLDELTTAADAYGWRFLAHDSKREQEHD